MPHTRRLLPLLALLSFVAGCGESATSLITPWFQKRYREGWVIAPHAWTLGSRTQMQIYVQGRWRTVASRSPSDIDAREVGGAVLVTTRGGRHRSLYREGREDPVRLPIADCPHVVGVDGRPALLCIGCGVAPPYRPVGRESWETGLAALPRCDHLSVSVLDLEGRVLSRRVVESGAVPFRDAAIEGATIEGDPILRVADVDHGCYAIRPHRLEPLPPAACSNRFETHRSLNTDR